jgi:hypothetical protein
MHSIGYHVVVLLLWFYGLLLVLGPIVLRIQFRYRASVDPQGVAFDALPVEVQRFIQPKIPGIESLGFKPVAYLSLGAVAPNVKGFMALFSNANTSEWADISLVTSAIRSAGYIEFITRCSEDLQVDTNTNATAPVLGPPVATRYVFRFPQLNDAFTLYRVHKMLAQQKTHGAPAVLPPEGREISELKRRLDRYGPQQQQRGYMYLDSSGNFYRLTWKGAVLGAWRSVWPMPVFRRWRLQARNRTVLKRLGVA